MANIYEIIDRRFGPQLHRMFTQEFNDKGEEGLRKFLNRAVYTEAEIEVVVEWVKKGSP